MSNPKIKLSGLKLPNVKLPDVKLPDIKLPDFKIPDGLWSNWFTVDEIKLREILQQVRSDLPTTEAILIGKPQSGKSSIVRALTGVSSDIIGPGFRPHTQHTSRYVYPNEDLPLLQFVDTVGLGDGQNETKQVIQELAEILNQSHTARLIIWTIKVNDFATASLKQIAQDLRSHYPQVPCLLAITCLHELYSQASPQELNHPEYPPTGETIDRAVQQIKQDFAGFYDDVVLIDFTLEEDEFSPLFYGLEPFSGAIESLLPEAEARTIAQLVNDRQLSAPVGDLYREVARRTILPFSVAAGTCAAVPLPLATMPLLTGIQVSMVIALGKLYGQTLTPAQAGGLVSTIAGGFVAQTIGRELVKLVPGFGSVIAASWATAYTWALGEAACVYFGDLMGGKTPDPKRIQALMKDSFEEAKSNLHPLK